ncbi:uncharacterized protein LOC135702144 [Ochlerotatus camptorhynchus]|uniref:uncharacterized protein LOC135702144 n=1 Tax=Ochlerotatus camptorhynchus TaxID=644619 RepID=UPI0031D8CDEE
MENAEILFEYFSESSDEEEEFAVKLLLHAQGTVFLNAEKRRGGSQPGKRPNINRHAEEGAARLHDDYFSETSTYTNEQFRRRFRMHRNLFLKITTAMETNEYFLQKPDATDVYCGKTPPVEFSVNGRTYNTGYYLADGIYPPLSTLVQTISSPAGQKRKYFAEKQESARKDVERAFGVLMARFAIIKNPATYTRLWNKEDLKSIIRTCIILHNMIIENERDDPTPFDGEENIVGPPLNRTTLARLATRRSVATMWWICK